MKGAGILVGLAFLWSDAAIAADLCRDASGRFSACPDAVEEPRIVPEPFDAPAPEASPAPREEPGEGLTLAALVGAVTVASTDTKAEVEPYASLLTKAPLTTWKRGPRLEVLVELSPLPGESLYGADRRTFKAIDVGGGPCQALPRPLRFDLCATGGFASRLATSDEPRERLPGYLGGGLLFETADTDNRLKVEFLADQRLTGEWAPALVVRGQLKIPKDVLGSAGVYLVGSYIRAITVPGVPSRFLATRDALRVGLAVGSK